MSLPLLIPAAGLSRRLGRPKQLEKIDGISLLRSAATRALASHVGPVHILLGHAAAECQAELAGLPVTTHLVPDYAEGMAATLRHGVAALAHTPALLITLVDQIALTPADLTALATAWTNAGTNAGKNAGKNANLPMAAAQYPDGTLGPPAIFAQSLYPKLLQLTGDQGARRLLRENPSQVLAIPLPSAEPDYDGS